jgi:hypothetical protein
MSQIVDLGKLRFFFAGEWDAATVYEANDVVKYGGDVYVYTYSLKTSGKLPTDITYWALMLHGFRFKGAFIPSLDYRIGDSVAYGGKVYICIQDNNDANPNDPAKWSLFIDGIQFKGSYDPLVGYRTNDIVSFGASTYIAKSDFVGRTPQVGVYWDKFVEGISPRGVFNIASEYHPGDTVGYGASMYQCTETCTGVYPTDTSKWLKVTAGVQFKGDWASGNAYIVDDVVRYGGSTYVCISGNTAKIPTSWIDTYWVKQVSGIRYRHAWSQSVQYLADDIVVSGSSTYICIADSLGGVAPASLGGNANFEAIAVGSADAISRGGDVMTGPLTLAGDPLNPLEATPKQYVDTKFDAVSTLVAAAAVTFVPLITADTVLAQNKLGLSADVLEVSGNAVYTIAPGAVHQVINF